MTKKRVVLLTVLMTAVFFVILMLLPESIVGAGAGNKLFFAVKAIFLSLTAAVAVAIVLLFIFKREYVHIQLATFNRFKYLLRFMVRRDFIARYRKSVLGVLWSLLNPLLTMLVMTIVFSYLFRNNIANFPVYLLSGQLIFGFFNESTTQAMHSVVGSEGIIQKVYVPKYIFPVSKVLSSLINVLFSFIALLFVIIVTRAPFHITMLLIPIPLIYIFVFSLGVSMLLSAMAVFFRDLNYLWNIFTLMLMYLTPLFYPVTILPAWLSPYMGLNPLYHFVDYFRALVMRGQVPVLWENIVCIGFALASLCLGTYVFMSKQERFILSL